MRFNASSGAASALSRQTKRVCTRHRPAIASATDIATSYVSTIKTGERKVRSSCLCSDMLRIADASSRDRQDIAEDITHVREAGRPHRPRQERRGEPSASMRTERPRAN